MLGRQPIPDAGRPPCDDGPLSEAPRVAARGRSEVERDADHRVGWTWLLGQEIAEAIDAVHAVGDLEAFVAVDHCQRFAMGCERRKARSGSEASKRHPPRPKSNPAVASR